MSSVNLKWSSRVGLGVSSASLEVNLNKFRAKKKELNPKKMVLVRIKQCIN